MSLKEFFDTIKEVSQKNIGMFRVPAWLAMAASYVQLFLAKVFGIYPAITPDWTRLFLLDWHFSSEKAEKELGYKVTPFKEAIKETLAWLDRKEKPGKK
jgi:nucleoside-diphosphate-sugar epimerase